MKVPKLKQERSSRVSWRGLVQSMPRSATMRACGRISVGSRAIWSTKMATSASQTVWPDHGRISGGAGVVAREEEKDLFLFGDLGKLGRGDGGGEWGDVEFGADEAVEVVDGAD